MAQEVERDLEVRLKTEDRFPPPPEFAAQANVSDPKVYDEAEADFEKWWESWAEKLDWFERWETVLEWNAPWAKWFQEGKLNVSHNCLDRRVAAGSGDKVAYHWVGEDDERRTSPIPSCSRRPAASRTSCATSASRRATSSASTCR